MSDGQGHVASFVPVYHWRGGRPHLVDLAPDQTGWLTCLCLQREGDVSLIPLAWQVNAADEHDMPPFLMPTLHTQALDETAVTLTLRQLQGDGWQISGQIDLTFTGRDTTPDFEGRIRQRLWRTPGEKHGD